MTKREELKKKYARLKWDLPPRFDRLGDAAVENYLAGADAALEARSNKRKSPSAEEEARISAAASPPADPPVAEDDGLKDCADEIQTKQILPDFVEECAEHLRTALRLFIRRRMWLASSAHRNDPEVQEYRAQAKKAVARAVCCVVAQDGSGYERGARIMSIFDSAITEMRNEFTDALVAYAVMNNLLSDKHQVEMMKLYGGQ